MDSVNEMNDFRVNKPRESRASFGEVVVEGFNYGLQKVKVVYWASCLEQHEKTTG